MPRAAVTAPRLHAPEPAAPPAPATHGDVWADGAVKVVVAAERSGLSRGELWSLMDAGVLVWMSYGEKRTRLIAWRSVVRHLERMYEQWLLDHPEHAPPDPDGRE